MRIETQVHGTVTVLIPHGPLVSAEVPGFRQAYQTAVSNAGVKSARIVIDMGDVPYLDSQGIEALLEVSQGDEGGLAIPRFARLSETCREALDLTSVLGRLELFDTVENAIRSAKR